MIKERVAEIAPSTVGVITGFIGKDEAGCIHTYIHTYTPIHTYMHR